VPIPTQREASPEFPLGALGRTRVAVDSRIKELSDTGPVLKAGPIAAFTDTIAVAARTDTAWLKEGIVANVVRGVCRFILVALTSLKQNREHLYSPPSRQLLLAELFLSIHSGGI
jgi:hypothetical protein